MTQATLPKTNTITTTVDDKAYEVPKIQVTTDYGQFRLMKGNRSVDYNHVKKLKREMERNPQLLASNPILVNEHLFIIDGQHRRMAAQELGVPVFYIVSAGSTIEATRHLNTSQKRWQLLDFARSYADSGREDYVQFLQFHKEFPEIPPAVLRVYLAGGQKHQMAEDFMRGEFKVSDLDEARSNLQNLQAVIDKTHIQLNAPMAHALLQLWSTNDDFDNETFMSKLDRENARELLRPASAIRACLRSIEDVYNFQSKFQTRLY